MNRNFDLDKEYEYVKNKEAALSHSATDMIKKILLIEEHFKKGQLFFIKDDTTFNFSIDDYSHNDNDYLAKRATVLFKPNVKYINSEQEDIDPENFKHLKEINSSLLNEFCTIYIQSYDELRHKDEQTVTEMLKNKIEQTLYSMGFSREITLENRFDFYSDSLLFSLDEHLHPYIPDFINSLKNNYDYTLKLDVFGEEIVFLTNNFKEVYFFDDEEISFIDDLSEAFFFYKEVEHIQMLFNQIPENHDRESSFIFHIQPNFSEVINEKNGEEKVIFKIEKEFDFLLKTRFIIDPKDFKKSLMSVLFYFNDADESNEITENEKIATKLILQRENKIIKSSLTDEKDYQTKRRL